MRPIFGGALRAAAIIFALCASSHAYADGFVGVCDPVTPGHCIQPNADGSVNVSGSFAATLSGFTPNGNVGTPVSVTTTSSSQQLPATSAVVLIGNKGSSPAYVRLGDSSVAATVNDIMVPAGGGCALTVGANTYIAAITASASTTLNTAGGTGLGQTCFGGGSGSGGGGGDVNITAVGGNSVSTTLPVSCTVTANLGTLNGAATAANQTTGNSSLSNIDASTAATASAVSGVAQDTSLTQVQGTYSTVTGNKVYVMDPSTGNPLTYTGATDTNLTQIGGTSASVNSGSADGGTLRVVPATGSSVSLVPATSGGLSTATAALSTTVTSVKASAGQVYGWYVYNANSTACYLQVFNTASGSVTLGTTTPTMSLGIPAGGGANVAMPNGIAFSTAISMAATTTRAGSTACTSAIDVNIQYK